MPTTNKCPIYIELERLKPFNYANILHWINLRQRLKNNYDLSPDPKIITQALAIRDLENEAKQFLDNLRYDPRLEVKRLCDSITQMILDFEETHPTGQSETTHFTLKNLSSLTNLNTIDANLTKRKSTENNYYRLTYLELCGALYAHTTQLKAVNAKFTDATLLTHLSNLCKTTHINCVNNLPDDLALADFDCITAYRLKYFRMYEPPKTLAQDFKTAIRELNGALILQRNYFPLSKVSAELAEKIRDTIKAQFINSRDTYDIKFALKILKATTELISPLTPDEQNLNNYLRLANLAEGSPLADKKLKALMYGLLTTSMIIASMVAGICSGGMLMSLTIPWMIANFVLLASVSAALGLASASSGYKSYSLFKEGSRQGLSKNMSQLVQELATHPHLRSH